MSRVYVEALGEVLARGLVQSVTIERDGFAFTVSCRTGGAAPTPLAAAHTEYRVGPGFGDMDVAARAMLLALGYWVLRDDPPVATWTVRNQFPDLPWDA